MALDMGSRQARALLETNGGCAIIQASPVRYRADPPALRLTEPLDGLVAVFHRPSGVTHLLASPASEILDILGDGPMTAAALLARLETDFALADPDPGALAERLAELVEAGLVTST